MAYKIRLTKIVPITKNAVKPIFTKFHGDFYVQYIKRTYRLGTGIRVNCLDVR